ncbi:MAG: type II toxin-antitoxin system RelE/ParE family toxin [Ruminococcus sp.]|nr:type II toxin-antitoxin system RelE/ParE family toxin [Ruminococcus sp.]
MTEYDVIITPDAGADLYRLKEYIANTLNEPQAALKYIKSLRSRIEQLRTFPNATAPVTEEPWRSKGIRRILHKNFYVYYKTANEENRVYVLKVIYSRRDQLNALSEYEDDTK